MPEYAGFFRKMPVNASGMDFTHKCRQFPNPGIQINSVYKFYACHLLATILFDGDKETIDLQQHKWLNCNHLQHLAQKW